MSFETRDAFFEQSRCMPDRESSILDETLGTSKVVAGSLLENKRYDLNRSLRGKNVDLGPYAVDVGILLLSNMYYHPEAR